MHSHLCQFVRYSVDFTYRSGISAVSPFGSFLRVRVYTELKSMLIEMTVHRKLDCIRLLLKAMSMSLHRPKHLQCVCHPSRFASPFTDNALTSSNSKIRCRRQHVCVDLRKCCMTVTEAFERHLYRERSCVDASKHINSSDCFADIMLTRQC